MIVDVPGIPIRRRDGSIHYTLVDPEDFVWLNERRWCLQNGLSGYVMSNATAALGERVRLYMHRAIMGLGPVAEDARVVDHINRDKLDNRRANLRVVTQAQNAQNHPGHPGTSKHRGVHFETRRGKWVARAVVARHAHILGQFDTEEEAAAAAAAFRAEHMPFAVEAIA